MYVRIVTLSVRPGKTEDFDRVMQEQAHAAAKLAKGFRGGNVLTDRANDLAGSITFWDTREDAEAFSGTTRRQSLMASLGDFVNAEPQVQIFEVTLHVPVSS